MEGWGWGWSNGRNESTGWAGRERGPEKWRPFIPEARRIQAAKG